MYFKKIKRNSSTDLYKRGVSGTLCVIGSYFHMFDWGIWNKSVSMPSNEIRYRQSFERWARHLVSKLCRIALGFPFLCCILYSADHAVDRSIRKRSQSTLWYQAPHVCGACARPAASLTVMLKQLTDFFNSLISIVSRKEVKRSGNT
jgi:hypothetical protein